IGGLSILTRRAFTLSDPTITARTVVASDRPIGGDGAVHDSQRTGRIIDSPAECRHSGTSCATLRRSCVRAVGAWGADGSIFHYRDGRERHPAAFVQESTARICQSVLNGHAGNRGRAAEHVEYAIQVVAVDDCARRTGAHYAKIIR